MAKDDFMERASRHHAVPAMRRNMDRVKSAIGGQAQPHQSAGMKEEGAGGHAHGPVERTEVAKHKDGTAHVIAHHADGHAEIHQHPHHAAAQDHADHMMAGGEGSGTEAEAAQESQILGGEGAEGGEGEQEAECPDCGGKMVGGECTQCGYKEQAGGGPSGAEAAGGY